MNTYIQTIKDYVTAHKKYFVIGGEVLLGIIVLGVIAICIYNSGSKVVYQPARACDLLSFNEAKDLLGKNTLTSSVSDPTISGDTATSNCGYADGNPDTNSMIVAAVMVRSGINDKGVQQNKAEFSAGRPTKNTETVKNLGDGAYFNDTLGQLNILSGRRWIILSYGTASAPATNTLDNAITLGNKILH
jgi:hypothetical protein